MKKETNINTNNTLGITILVIAILAGLFHPLLPASPLILKLAFWGIWLINLHFFVGIVISSLLHGFLSLMQGHLIITDKSKRTRADKEAIQKIDDISKKKTTGVWSRIIFTIAILLISQKAFCWGFISTSWWLIGSYIISMILSWSLCRRCKNLHFNLMFKDAVMELKNKTK